MNKSRLLRPSCRTGRNLGGREDQRILLVGGSQDSAWECYPGGITKCTVLVPAHRERPGWSFQKFPGESGAHLVESSLTSGEVTKAQGEGGRSPGTERVMSRSPRINTADSWEDGSSEPAV